MKSYQFQIRDGHTEGDVVVAWPDSAWMCSETDAPIRARHLDAALNKLRPVVRRGMRDGDYGLTMRERAENNHVSIVDLVAIDGESGHWTPMVEVIACPSR